MSITQLDHVGIFVENLAAAENAFTSGLGLSVSQRISVGDTQATFLHAGPARIELIESPAAASALRDGQAQKPARIDHIAFSVSNLTAAVSELEARGTVFSSEAVSVGTYTTIFTDPASTAGVRLQLIQFNTD